MEGEKEVFNGEELEEDDKKNLLDSYLKRIKSSIKEDDYFLEENKARSFRIVEHYVENKWKDKTLEEFYFYYITTGLLDKPDFGQHVRDLFRLSMLEENKIRNELWEAKHYQTREKIPPPEEVDLDIHQKKGSLPLLPTIPDMAETVKNGILANILKVPKWIAQLAAKEFFTGIDEVLQVALGSAGNVAFQVGIGSLVGALAHIVYNVGCYHSGRKTLESAKKDVIDNVAGIFIGNGLGALFMATAGTALLTALGISTGGIAFAVAVPILSFAAGAVFSTGAKAIVGKFTAKYYNICKDEDLNFCFKKLKISRTATEKEIDSAWRKRSREFHPDYLNRRDPPPTKEEIEKAVKEFIEIQKAYKYVKAAREFERAEKKAYKGKSWWQKKKEEFYFFLKNLFSWKRKEYQKLEEPKDIVFDLEETFKLEEDEDLNASVGNQEVSETWWMYFWGLYQTLFTELDGNLLTEEDFEVV